MQMPTLLFSVLIALFCAAHIECGTTTTALPTTVKNHGQPIGHTFHFSFEQATRHMILSMGKMCYISKLTSDELSAIHTDAGLLRIEGRILSSIGSAISIPKEDVSHHDIKYCDHGHEQFFLLHV